MKSNWRHGSNPRDYFSCFQNPGKAYCVQSITFHRAGPDGVVLSPVEYDLENVSALSEAIKSTDSDSVIAHFYCITQDSSYRGLDVTEEFWNALSIHHGIMPYLNELVSYFYERKQDYEAATCCPFVHHTHDGIFEYAYGLRFPELRERPSPEDWSVRHTCLYHQYNTATNQSVYILFNPTPDSRVANVVVQALVAELKTSRANHFKCNDALLTHYAFAWRPYIFHFERQVYGLCADLSRPGRIKDDLSEEADRFGKMYYLESRISNAEAVLNSWMQTMHTLMTVNASGTLSSGRLMSVECNENCKAAIMATLSSIRVLLFKSEKTTQLLDRFMNIRNQQEASKQGAGIAEMTHITVNDSVSIHVITFITLLYLSFNAMATILDMPFFYLNESNSFEASPSVWIYVASSIPLTALTLVYWRWQVHKVRRDRDQRRRQRADLEQKQWSVYDLEKQIGTMNRQESTMISRVMTLKNIASWHKKA